MLTNTDSPAIKKITSVDSNVDASAPIKQNTSVNTNVDSVASIKETTSMNPNDGKKESETKASDQNNEKMMHQARPYLHQKNIS